MLRKCPKCGKVLPESMFAPNSDKCRICRRDYDWQYRYGLSPEQYLELFTAQEGKCKICEKELPDGEYLHVDHNQATGEVRGLLCDQCNRGIGFFHENIEVMKRAIKYLEENQ